jgi:hypothetical protein
MMIVTMNSMIDLSYINFMMKCYLFVNHLIVIIYFMIVILMGLLELFFFSNTFIFKSSNLLLAYSYD